MMTNVLSEKVSRENGQTYWLTGPALISYYDVAWITDDVPSLLGRPACSFGEFATDYATAFS